MRRFRINILFILQVFTAISLLAASPSNKVKAKLLKIHDGDTYIVKYENKIVSVRLIGVDTPEITGNFKARGDAKRHRTSIKNIIAWGKESKRFVSSIMHPGTEITLEFDIQRVDKYGRLLAYVYLPDGRMLNEVLLLEGYATLMTIPPNVKYVERFRKAYQYGVKNKKGMWN